MNDVDMVEYAIVPWEQYCCHCRYKNSPYKELSIAAIEQMKITEIRLRQLLKAAPESHAIQIAERRTGQTRAHLGEDNSNSCMQNTSHCLDLNSIWFFCMLIRQPHAV